MKFKFESAYFKPLNFEYWKNLLEDIVNVTIEQDNLYIEVNNLCELEDIINKIPKDLYNEDSGGWKEPKEFIINFEEKIITLYDYYIE